MDHDEAWRSFSGGLKPTSISGLEFLLKVIGCGPVKEKDRQTSVTGFTSAFEPHVDRAGARGVRSVKPRRRPEDFMSPVGHRVTQPQGVQ
ncbi:MAG: hypothetical protein JWN70_5163 [Planctomycetaceae bacterium]|nr:hypothetical protein [Planctomycetaceae bacterium]